MTDRAKILQGDDITPELEDFHAKLWEAAHNAASEDGIDGHLILGSFLSIALDMIWISGMTEEEAARIFNRFANTVDDYYEKRKMELN